jgi:phage shock protein A
MALISVSPTRHTFFALQAMKDSSHALERLAVAREKGYQALLDAEQHFLTSLHDVHVKHLDENIHALEQRHREMFSQQLTAEVGKEHDRMRETLKKTINQKGVYHMAAVRKTTASVERRRAQCS